MALFTACPNCQHSSLRALIHPRYVCPQCGVPIHSNLRSVSLVEWLVGGPFLYLVAAMLERLPWFNGWSFGAITAVLFIPACGVHYAVLRQFLTLSPAR